MPFIMDFLQNSFIESSPNSEQWLDFPHEEGSYQKSTVTSEEKIQLTCLNSLIDYMCCDLAIQEVARNPTELNTSVNKSPQVISVINDAISCLKPCNPNAIGEDTGILAENDTADLIALEESAVSYYSEMLNYHGHCQVLSIQELFEFKLNSSSAVQKISGSDIHQFINFLMLYPDHFLVTNKHVIGKKKIVKLSSTENKKFTDPLLISIFYFFKNYTKNESLFDIDKLYQDVGRNFLYSDRTPIFNSKDDLISFLGEYPNVFYADSHRVINLISSCNQANLNVRNSYRNSTAWFVDSEIKKNVKNDTYELKTMGSRSDTEGFPFYIEQQPQADPKVISGDTLEDTSPTNENNKKDEDTINTPKPETKIDYLPTMDSTISTEGFAQQPRADTNILSGNSEDTSPMKENNKKDENTINRHETKIDYLQTCESTKSTESFAFGKDKEHQADTNVLSGDSFEDTSPTKENNEKDKETIIIQEAKMDYCQTMESTKSTECIAFDIEKQLQADTNVLSGDSIEYTAPTKENNKKDEYTVNIHEQNQETKIDYLQTMESMENIEGFAFETEQLPQVDINVLCPDTLKVTSFINESNYKHIDTINIHEPTLETKIKYWSTMELTKPTDCMAFDIEKQLQADTNVLSGDSFKDTSPTKETNKKAEDTIDTHEQTQEKKINYLQTMESPNCIECFAFDREQQLQADTNVLAGDSLEYTSPTKENNKNDENTINTHKTKMYSLQTLESSRSFRCFAFDMEKQPQADANVLPGVSFQDTSLTKQNNIKDEVTINIHEKKIGFCQTMESPKSTEGFAFDSEQLPQVDTNVLSGDSLEDMSPFKENNKKDEVTISTLERKIDSLPTVESMISTEGFAFDREQQLQAVTNVLSGYSLEYTSPTKENNKNDENTINTHKTKMYSLQTLESLRSFGCFAFDMEKQPQADTNVLPGVSFQDTSLTKQNNLKDEVTINIHEKKIGFCQTMESPKSTKGFAFDSEQLPQVDTNVLSGDSLEDTSPFKENNIKDKVIISTLERKIDYLQTMESLKITDCFAFDIKQHPQADKNEFGIEQHQAEPNVSYCDTLEDTSPTYKNNKKDEDTINKHKPKPETKIDYLQTMESRCDTECFPFYIEQQPQADPNVISGDTLDDSSPTDENNKKDTINTSKPETKIDYLQTMESTKCTECFAFDRVQQTRVDTNLLPGDTSDDTSPTKENNINDEVTINTHETKIYALKSSRDTECFAFNLEQQPQVDTNVLYGDFLVDTSPIKENNKKDEGIISTHEPTQETKVDYLQTMESMKCTECFASAIEQQPPAITNFLCWDTLGDTSPTKENNINVEVTINTQETKVDYLQTMESMKCTECFASAIEQQPPAVTNFLCWDTLGDTSPTKENNINVEVTINTHETKIYALESSRNTECFAFDMDKADTNVLSGDSCEDTSLTKENNENDKETINMQEKEIDYCQTMESTKSTECFAFDIEQQPQVDTNVLSVDSLEYTAPINKKNKMDEVTINTHESTKETKVDYLQTMESTKSTECFAFDIEQQPQFDTNVLSADSLEYTAPIKEKNKMDEVTISTHESTKVDYLQTMESTKYSECFASAIEQPPAVTKFPCWDTLDDIAPIKKNNIKEGVTIDIHKPPLETKLTYFQTIETPKTSEYLACGTEQLPQADPNVSYCDTLEVTSLTNERNHKFIDTINIHEPTLETKIKYWSTMESPKRTECFAFDTEQPQAGTNILCDDTSEDTSPTIKTLETKINCLLTMEPSKNTDCFAFNNEQQLQPDSNVLCSDNLEDTSSIDDKLIIKPKTIWSHIWDMDKIDICEPTIDTKINDFLTITDHLRTTNELPEIKQCFPFDLQQQLQVGLNASFCDTFKETLCIEKNMSIINPVTSNSNICDLDVMNIHKESLETEMNHLGDTFSESQTIELTKCIDSFPSRKEQQQSNLKFSFGCTLDDTSFTQKNLSMITHKSLMPNIWDKIDICEPTIDTKINHLLTITDHLQTKLPTIESPKSNECFAFDPDQHLSPDLSLSSGETFEDSVSVEKNLSIINPVTSNSNFLNFNTINIHEPTLDTKIIHLPVTYNHLKIKKSPKFIESCSLNAERQQDDLMFSFGCTSDDTSSIEENLSMTTPKSLMQNIWDKINICEPTLDTKINHLLTITDHLQTKLPTIKTPKHAERFSFDTDDHLTANLSFSSGDTFEDTLSIEKNMPIIKPVASDSNIWNLNAVNICEPPIEVEINHLPATANQLKMNESLKSIECLANDTEPQQAELNVSFGYTLEDAVAIQKNKSTINPETPNYNFWDVCEPTLNTEINYLPAVESPKSNEYFASDAYMCDVELQIPVVSNILEENKCHEQFQNVHCRMIKQSSMGDIENSVVKLDKDNKKSILLQSTDNFISKFEGLKKKDFEILSEKALIFLNLKLWEDDELQILKIDNLFKLFLSESLDLTKYCKNVEDFKEFISMFQDDFIVSNNNVMAKKNKIRRSRNILEECVPIMLSNFFDMYTQSNDSITVKLLYERVGQHFYNLNQSKIFKFSEQLMLFLEMFPNLFYIDNNLNVINLTSARKNVNASLEVNKCDESVDLSVENKQLTTFPDPESSMHWKDLVLKKTQLIEDKNDCRRITEAILKSENIIAVDCEGVNLGAAGTLSLIQVGLVCGDVYIFDIVKDKTMVIEGGLKEIFESESIVKVIHDSRNDAANLYTEYGVEINKIFDTRVAHHLIVKSGITNYKQINNFIAIGLNELCGLYGAPINIEKDKMKSVYKSNHMFWNERPLTSVMLAYATLDVACLVPQLPDTMCFMIKNKGISEGLIWELSFKHSRSAI